MIKWCVCLQWKHTVKPNTVWSLSLSTIKQPFGSACCGVHWGVWWVVHNQWFFSQYLNLRASASCLAACFPLTLFGRVGVYCAIASGLWLLKECNWEGWRGEELIVGRRGDKVVHGNSKQYPQVAFQMQHPFIFREEHQPGWYGPSHLHLLLFYRVETSPRSADLSSSTHQDNILQSSFCSDGGSRVLNNAASVWA